MIKVALVGCGYWGKNYLRTLEQIPELKLAWVCNRRPLDKNLTLPPDCKFTKNYRDILTDETVQGVIIATPATTHHTLARQALEQGKDVLVEKPLTTNSKEALALERLAQKHERVLMVGHIFLFNPALLKLKELMARRELGPINHIYSQRSGPGPRAKDVDVLWHLAPHDIVIANFLIGQTPLAVTATRAGVDAVTATLQYKTTTVFTYVSWNEPVKTRQTIVVGSKKTALFDDVAETKLKVYDTADPSQVSYPPLAASPSPLEQECRHFLDCLRTRKKPLADGRAGYENVKILEELSRATETTKPRLIKY